MFNQEIFLSNFLHVSNQKIIVTDQEREEIYENLGKVVLIYCWKSLNRYGFDCSFNS